MPTTEDLDDWVDGKPVDWTVLWGNTPIPPRIALVPYPFQRRRYWLPQRRAASATSSTPVPQPDTESTRSHA